MVTRYYVLTPKLRFIAGCIIGAAAVALYGEHRKKIKNLEQRLADSESKLKSVTEELVKLRKKKGDH